MCSGPKFEVIVFCSFPLLSIFMCYLISVFVFLLQQAVTQIVQNNWIAPAGTEPDFQQTFTNAMS